jgi:hypothetical protein
VKAVALVEVNTCRSRITKSVPPAGASSCPVQRYRVSPTAGAAGSAVQIAVVIGVAAEAVPAVARSRVTALPRAAIHRLLIGCPLSS